MVKLISVIYRLRNIIKNYMKYRTNIIYDRYFIKVIGEFINNVYKGCYYSQIESLLLEYYSTMMDFPSFVCDLSYEEDSRLIRKIHLKNKSLINDFLCKINDFMYNDKELTEHQKDKLNYVIHKNFIR